MNNELNSFGKKQLWSNRRTIPDIARKSEKNNAKLQDTGDLAQTQTQHHPNKIQDRYRHASLLDGLVKQRGHFHSALSSFVQVYLKKRKSEHIKIVCL
jgi:hypothetical protein